MKIESLTIPFQAYQNEAKYIAPNTVSKESIAKIKARNIRLSRTALGEMGNL